MKTAARLANRAGETYAALGYDRRQWWDDLAREVEEIIDDRLDASGSYEFAYDEGYADAKAKYERQTPTPEQIANGVRFVAREHLLRGEHDEADQLEALADSIQHDPAVVRWCTTDVATRAA